MPHVASFVGSAASYFHPTRLFLVSYSTLAGAAAGRFFNSCRLRGGLLVFAIPRFIAAAPSLQAAPRLSISHTLFTPTARV